MNIAVLAESAADEIAIRILLQAALGPGVQLVETLRPPAGGWESLLAFLPTVLKHLYYQTDHDGLIVVIDSDNTPVHINPQTHRGLPAKACRICQFNEVVQYRLSELTQRRERSGLHVTIGMATPGIEAWLCHGKEYRCTEDHWVEDMARAVRSESRIADLKRRLHGGGRITRVTRQMHIENAATQLTANSSILETAFPNGFGALMRELRSWLIQSAKQVPTTWSDDHEGAKSTG